MPTDHEFENNSHNAKSDSVKPELSASKHSLPTRPPLKRDQSIPASQHNPFVPLLLPSASAQQQQQQQQQQHINNDPVNSIDPLSLGQIKRLVNDISMAEPAPYAFTYSDTASFREELEEWFTYDKAEQEMLLATWTSFSKLWGAFQKTLKSESIADAELNSDWVESTDLVRFRFIEDLMKGLQQHDIEERLQHIEALTYIALGSWHETAGLELEKDHKLLFTESDNKYLSQDEGDCTYAQSQLYWITMNMKFIASCGIVQSVMDLLFEICQQERYWLIISFRILNF